MGRPGTSVTLLLLLGSALPIGVDAQSGASSAEPPLLPAGGRRFDEVRRFASPAARQGVAVDDAHLYVVSNRALEKLDKQTGQRVASWEGAAGGPIVHLNGGVVLDGRLYCAHSNYPGVPMLSSIEIFDAATLEHVGSHSFGIGEGSATWVDRHGERWWVGFAHYDGRGGEPGRGSGWTRVVAFDAGWRRVSGYAFPPEVVERFAGRSNSGGSFGADGLLYATGHDAAEVYALRLPRAGSVLELVGILPAPIAGQGIVWDRSRPGVLYGIVKSARAVVVSRLAGP